MVEAVLRPGVATETMIDVGVGGGTGLIEGLVIRKLAPATGALEPIITWGTLLGVPTLAAIAAMFTRGRTSDALRAMAAGGSGVLGYQIPVLAEGLGRGLGGHKPLGGQDIKQLTQGRQPGGLGIRDLAQARTGLEF